MRTGRSAKPPGLSEQLEEVKYSLRRQTARLNVLLEGIVSVIEQTHEAGRDCCEKCPVCVLFCAGRPEGENCRTSIKAWVESEIDND